MTAVAAPDQAPAASALQAAVAELDPISLDGVLNRAALQTRTDRKYFLPASAVPALFTDIGGEFAVLEIDGRTAAAYDSAYFDTPRLELFRAHRQRRRRRYKVRTRSYLDTHDCLLEVKCNSGRGDTIKRRIPYQLGDRAQLTAQGEEFISSTLEEVYGLEPPPLGRTLSTTYHRTTLVAKHAPVRVTCDTDLDFVGRDHTVATRRDYVLLETKTGPGPDPIAAALRRQRIRPVSVSKYCAAVAALVPDAISNPWRQVLRRYLL